jgi:hypothetical protein
MAANLEGHAIALDRYTNYAVNLLIVNERHVHVVATSQQLGHGVRARTGVSSASVKLSRWTA